MINQLHKTFINPETLINAETPIKFKVSRMMSKAIDKLATIIRHSLKQISILLIPVPLFMLITGTEGIIKQECADEELGGYPYTLK